MKSKATMVVHSVLRTIPFFLRNRIKAIPGVAHLQRAIVSRTLDGKEFDHTVDGGPAKGVKFHIAMPEDKGIWTGTYEIGFATRLAAEMKPGIVAYDIGSWHGFFAGVMAAHSPREVHVFEPLPANAERIRRMIALNPDCPITLHACAAGERDAEMDLLIMPHTSMAKLENSTFQPAKISGDRVRVNVRSIDSMVDAGEIAPPAIMKIDVEGAEVFVLIGARETIRRHRPIIFAEIHSASLLDQCRELLATEGYLVELIDTDPTAAHAQEIYQVQATPSSIA